MDGQTFDELIRATTQAPTRRGALGLLAGAALSGLAWIDQAEAKKRRRKNKKKKKKGGSNAPPAGGCTSDAECGAGQACQGGSCVPLPPPPPPECDDDIDCEGDEICQNGTCVPEPECIIDGDCGDNEICQNGGCICPEVLENRCVVRCTGSSDCPDGCGCLGLFPGSGQPRVVCVNDSGNFCGRPSCTNSSKCDDDEICVFTTCGGFEGSGRCLPICVSED